MLSKATLLSKDDKLLETMKSIIKNRFLKRFRSVDVQVEHRTANSRLSLEEEDYEVTLLHVGKKNESSLAAKEIDVFQECECEFDDSIPDMISSSSSSSSVCNSPAREQENCKSNESERGVTSLSIENLLNFEEKWLPGGNDKVILYTTSVRGIRKTYEDCRAIKFLLESFRVVYSERDVSMNLEFRDELWEALGRKSIPPRLFIKGRHIGGTDRVVTLHECGVLKVLLEGIPVLGLGSNVKCRDCGGVKFLVCLDCNGSCKIFNGGEPKNKGSLFGRCPKCNENGLIKCPTCSY